MKPFQRKKLLVERQVQGAFLLRAVTYWLTCVLMVLLLLFFTNMVAEPVRSLAPEADGPWLRVGPTVLCAVLFLPVVVYDFLRVSNRLVGPVLRLRKAMRALAAGEHVEPLRFRDGDFWQEFADEFNAVARLVHSSGGCCAKRAAESPEAELVGAGAQ
ncbi:MAG TPA: hypothetical protein VHC22_18465 [Pirellulales bacterium]|nr:hypothetical protein [Pirellulales bacterium]